MGDDVSGKSGPGGDKKPDQALYDEDDGPEVLTIGSLIFGPTHVGVPRPLPTLTGLRGKRRPVALDPNVNPFPSWQDKFTTTEAALYCRFRTPQGLRKAWYHMEVFPVGRRGGRGTLIWARAELDRFLRGEALLNREATGFLLPPKMDTKVKTELAP